MPQVRPSRFPSWLFLLILLAWPLLAGRAETTPRGRLTLKEYDREDGLPSSALTGFVQDREGLLWLITENGAISYDGQRFIPYQEREGLEKPHLLSGTVDSRGRLWFAGWEGLYYQEGGRFVAAAPFKDRFVRFLGPWSQGRVIIQVRDLGLMEGDAASGFKPLPLPAGPPTTAFLSEASGVLWIAQGTRICQRRADGTWRTWGQQDGLVFSPRVKEETIQGLVMDGTGTLWARSASHLFRLSKDGARWEDLGREVPTSSRIMMCRGIGDRLWVHSDQALLLRTGGRWYRFGREHGLPSVPYTFFEDREGSLWMHAGTLQRLGGRGALESIRQGEGLPGTGVWGLFRDSRGTIFVGTDTGAACSRPDGGWEAIPELGKAWVGAFCEARDGSLYASTSNQGLFRRASGSSTFKPVSMKGGGVHPFAHALIQDRRGRFWMGTDDVGLWMGTPNGGRLDFVRVGAKAPREREWVGKIHEDARGRIWVASSRGLRILDGETWHLFTQEQGLLPGWVAGLWVDDQGHFWCGSDSERAVLHGVYEEGRMRALERLDKARGFTDAAIYAVFKDTRGRLWISTGAGVDVLDGSRMMHFGRADGLAGEEGMTNRYLVDEGGSVWIGSSNGLTHFRQELWGEAPNSPAIHVSDLRLGRIDGLGLVDPKVPFADRQLDVRFSGLSMINEKARRLRARLAGLDQGWREVDEGHLRLERLPAGAYELELQARSGLGPWGPVWRYAFRVASPWWGTWWFRSALVLLFALGIHGLVRWRTHTLHERARLLEEKVQARTGELATALGELSEANSSLHNLSLTDPLTGLRNRRFLLSTITDDISLVLRNYEALRRQQFDRASVNVDLLFLMVDLDHFKRVNDTYGHAAGDAVLTQTRDVLISCVRESDSVIRWGGEEFLVLGRAMQGSEAPVIASRIREALAAHPFALPEGEILHMTCSIGWAFFPFLAGAPGLLNWERVLDVADACLYTAKKSGRNMWVGVAASATAAPEDLGPHWMGRLGELVEAGVLQVQCGNQEEGAELHW